MEKPDFILPKVSVIIANYNHGKYAERCLDSIAAQDYPDIHAVICDDCSTDDSYTHILSLLNDTKVSKIVTDVNIPVIEDVYVGTYKNIQVSLLKMKYNSKQAATRNAAIKYSWNITDIFGMLDMDDEYLPTKISKSVAKIVEDPERIGLVYSDVLIKHESDNHEVYEAREPYVRHRLENECIISNAPLFTKRVLNQVGLFDEDLPPCEDWDLWIRITEVCVAIHIPEALQRYNVTGKNCTYTVSSDIWQKQWTKVQQKLINRLHVKSRA